MCSSEKSHREFWNEWQSTGNETEPEGVLPFFCKICEDTYGRKQDLKETYIWNKATLSASLFVNIYMYRQKWWCTYKNCTEQKIYCCLPRTKYFGFSMFSKYSLKILQCLHCPPPLLLSEMCNRKRSTQSQEITKLRLHVQCELCFPVCTCLDKVLYFFDHICFWLLFPI